MNTSTNCLDVRRILGAEPQRRDPALLEHCRVCAACAAFLREMLALDGRIAHALAVEVPEGLEARIVFKAAFRPARPRTYAWLATAAAALLAVGLGFGVWRMAPGPERMTLAQALVAHIQNKQEAAALDPDRPVLTNVSLVHRVLARVGVRMHGDMNDVTYARVCPFRGELVAHLVVKGKDGPVTILLLPHIHVDKPTHFDESGYRGIIEPAGRGSIAIVANNDSPMQTMAKALPQMLQWAI